MTPTVASWFLTFLLWQPGQPPTLLHIAFEDRVACVTELAKLRWSPAGSSTMSAYNASDGGRIAAFCSPGEDLSMTIMREPTVGPAP